MQDGVDEHAKVRFFVTNTEMEILVDLVEGFRVDSFGEIRMFLGPVLENKFKVRTDANGFLKQFVDVLVEEELEGVGDKHEVENEVFVFGLVAGITYHISHLLRILSYQFIADVPVGFPDHVCEEDGLHLVHQENFSYCLQHFVDRVFESYGAAASHRAQNGHDPSQFAPTVGVESFAVTRRDIPVLVLFVHFNDDIWAIKKSTLINSNIFSWF